ncbi:arsenate reductase and related [Beijerinckia indica subsp. indica ATCC 9039]|uniref:Arsenate reductase and related n=1 Tax=Beijerinckia indica subsp. indica (strain ATCC 9039 / DSM 1715 / NCIMB 8712) TaxID=395963 RepID=B2IG21_BEII9|nr:arsenate reductase-like protein [Beijerinckia indica]ACB95758.1 arsenate reductase and related [Beijerinckia indica subsp. indica ATCC 9039]
MSAPIDIIIYHNPDCGTSRNTLAMIRNAGIEPHVIEYLKTPPSRPLLEQLIARMGVPVRAVIREKDTLCAIDRCHDGASDPDQSSDRRLAARRQTLPTFRNRSRSLAQAAARSFHKGGWAVVDDDGQRVI